MTTDGLQAAHPVIGAVPFFVPTIIVVAVIGVLIWRDRRRGDTPDDDSGADSGADS